METIKELYWDYIQTKRYGVDLACLEDERTKMLEQRIEIFIDTLPKEINFDIENLIFGYVAEKNSIEFILGFKYAMQILNACGIKVGDVA